MPRNTIKGMTNEMPRLADPSLPRLESLRRRLRRDGLAEQVVETALDGT